MRWTGWIGCALILVAGLPYLAPAEDAMQLHRERKTAVEVHRSTPHRTPEPEKRVLPSKAELKQLEKHLQQGHLEEARRILKKLMQRYPKWRPPEDWLSQISKLETIAAGEREIWRLLGEGRVPDAQAVMKRLQDQVPGWRPSPEMLRVAKIAAAEPELWDLLHEGDLGAIEKRLKELKQIAPDWQPSPAFQQEYRKAQLDAALEQAWRKRDWKRIVKLYQEAPDLFDCSGLHRRLKLADAYLGLGEEAQAAKVLAAGFGHCKEPLNFEALEYAASHLPPRELGKLIAEIRKYPLSQEGRHRVALVEFRYLQSSGLNGLEWARRLREIEDDLLLHPSAALVRSIAWIYLDAGMAEDALRMFQRARAIQDSAEARKGEIMALHRMQRWREVRARVQEGRAMLQREGVLPDVLPLLADACVHLNDDACVIRTLTQLDQVKPLEPKQRLVLAWAQYRKGQAKEAAVSFERVYRANPSAEAAEGLRLSLFAAGEPLKLAQLARELDGPLAAEHGRQVAQRFYDAGLYHAALAAGSVAPGLEGADSDRVSIGWSHRRVSANLLTPALDQLALSSWTMIGDHFLRPNRWIEVRVDRIRLDAGPPVLLPADHVGTAVIAPPVTYPVRTRWTGYEWNIGYRQEGWTSWEIRIGQGFRGGPLAPDWKGLLRVDRRFDIGWIRVEAHRQPVRSTMLSYIGLQAPQAPIIWGRVSRTGLGFSSYLDTGIRRLGLYAALGFEEFTGKQVASNRRMYGNFSLPVHLGRSNWRVDVVPTFTWMRYRHDRNHFTVGHGGYFSPQRYQLVGIYLEAARKVPGERFHFRLSGLWGRQRYYQEAAVRLPLTPNPLLPPFLAQRVSSSVLDGKAELDILLGGHWKLSGILRSNLSEHFVLGVRQFYRNQEFLLALTWNQNTRAGLLEGDPPALGVEHLE